jgi:hypothetical protein
MEPKRRTLILSFSVVILIILSAISGFGPAASLIDEDGDGIFDRGVVKPIFYGRMPGP